MRYAPCGRGKRYLETTAGARRLRNPGAKTGVHLLLFNQIDDACSGTCTAAGMIAYPLGHKRGLSAKVGSNDSEVPPY